MRTLFGWNEFVTNETMVGNYHGFHSLCVLGKKIESKSA